MRNGRVGAAANVLHTYYRAQCRYILSARTNSGTSNCGRTNRLSGWSIQLEQDWIRDNDAGTAQADPSTYVVIAVNQMIFFRRGEFLLLPAIFCFAVQTTGGSFNTGTGIFTAPYTGVYLISGFGRCERQACDVTFRYMYIQ